MRDHRSAVDQMHSYRLRRKFSKALRRVLWPYARAPKKRGARPLRTARAYVAPVQIPTHCSLMNPTKAQVDEATDQCVNTLTGSAQFRGCFFEDDAGRAEDKRTGLSCPERQAALAKQCLKRCANYASDTTHLVCTGSYPNTVWHISFGDISGDTGDSARVDLCGPRLRASLSSQLR